MGKFFTLHMNLESQIPIYNNASFDHFDFNNEKLHCTPTYLMRHKFLDVKKKWIMKILYIHCPKSIFSPFRFI